MAKEIKDKKSYQEKEHEYEENLSKMNILEKIMHYAYICCRLVDNMDKEGHKEEKEEFKAMIMEYLNKILVTADKDIDKELYLKLKKSSWENLFRVIRKRKMPIKLVNGESLGNFHTCINHLEEQFNEIIENRENRYKKVVGLL